MKYPPSNRFPFSIFWRIFERIRRFYYKIHHIYPVDGASLLVGRLMAAVEKTNIDIILGTTVEAAVLNDDQSPNVFLTTRSEDGRAGVVETRSMIVTPRSHLKRIIVNHQARDVGFLRPPIICPHIVIKARAVQDSPYSYIDFQDHAFIRRAQNQSESLRLAGKIGKTEEIHIIHLKQGCDDVSAQQALDELRRLKFVKKGTEIIECSTNQSLMTVIDSSQLANVKNQTKGKIIFLKSHNLSIVFGHHWERWRKIAPDLRF